jgi:hypothetical protein
MSMSASIQAYYQAFAAGDFETMRSYLKDDFDFTGPLDTRNNADEYIERISVLKVFQAKFELLELMEKENRLMVRFDWTVLAPVSLTIPMVEWFVFEDEKIKKSELFFDSKRFEPLFPYLPLFTVAS